MTDDEPPGAKDFRSRLRAARERDAARGGKKRRPLSQSGLAVAFRFGVEMVSAVGVGVALGWLLDAWLGTRPWLMIVFFVLGSAAGIMNVYRSAAGFGQGVGYRPAEDDEEDRKPDNGRNEQG